MPSLHRHPRTLLPILIVLIWAGCAWAGQPAPAPSVADIDRAMNEALALLGLERDADATPLLTQAREMARALGDSRREAEATRRLAVIALDRGELTSAETQLDAAAVLFESVDDQVGVARVLRHRASLADQRGDRQEALRLASQVLPTFERLGLVEDQVRTLYLLVRAGEDSNAVQALHRGIELAHSAQLHELEGILVHSRGDWRFGLGEFDAALKDYETASALYERAGRRGSQARVWVSMGRLHRAHGAYAESLAYYERARDLQRAIGDRPGEIQSINAIATALNNLERQDDALKAYEDAYALAQTTTSPRIVNFQRGNLGGHYIVMRQFDKALPLVEESARLEPNPTTKAIRLVQLGIVLRELGRREEALVAFNEAVDSLRRLNNNERLFPILMDRALLLQQFGRTDEAIVDARAALDVVEKIRARLAPSDFLKQGFNQRNQSIYELAIGLLTQAKRHDEALEAAEQGRARAFVDLLASRTRKASDSQQAADDARRAASLADIRQEAVRLGAPVIAYWVGEKTTWIWAVATDGTLTAASSPVGTTELDALVDAVWAGLDEGPGAFQPTGRGDARGTTKAAPVSPRRAARLLYQHLLAPVAAALPNRDDALVTLIPHGPLLRVSFSALVDDRDRYMVERFAFHYAPSVATLLQTARRRHAAAGGSERVLLVANPSGMPSVDSAALPPLPGTAQEADAVAHAVGAGRVTRLEGSAATERGVRAALGTAGIAHFATHGVVDDKQPLASFLALSSTSPEAGDNDGRLSTEEIYAIPMAADLVVLSACRSGLGRVSADGMVGLTRAFFSAGAPSLVATLWDVADAPPARLWPAFYERVGTLGKARALRQAQLSLLADLRAGRVTTQSSFGPVALNDRPVFWANFILIGEP
ncbi:MAG: CHAT domain-containing protein [Acidobacteria bacterium]|nr:CHAT domain-containing protein [Acidobacteriota bacterium]